MFDKHRAYEIHAVSTCICKQCHARRKKLDYLPQSKGSYRFLLEIVTLQA